MSISSCLVEKAQAQFSLCSSSWFLMLIPELLSQVSGPNSPVWTKPRADMTPTLSYPMTMSSVKSANSMLGVSRLKICWSISSKATRHARMLNLWTTSRRRRTSMKREDRLSINSSWIGLLTSSRPRKNLNSGVRGQLGQVPYFQPEEV
jgi:hypothetical protein